MKAVKRFLSAVALGAGVLVTQTAVSFESKTPLFELNGTTYKYQDVYDDLKAEMYKLDKKRYGKISEYAEQMLLTEFWEKQRRALKTKDIGEAQRHLFDTYGKVTPLALEQIKESMKQGRGFNKLSPDEQDRAARENLRDTWVYTKEQEFIKEAKAKGQFKVFIAEPRQPRFDLPPVTAADSVRYGPGVSGVDAKTCGKSCDITVVEYSDFECPYCAKLVDEANFVLAKYKGRIRWVARDFPLSFHKEAVPAAVAARCAQRQDRFWPMYMELFKNFGKLSRNDLTSHARTVGVDLKAWSSCMDQPPKAITARIDQNLQSARKFSISGTPSLFVNGYKVQGARRDAIVSVIEEVLQGRKNLGGAH